MNRAEETLVSVMLDHVDVTGIAHLAVKPLDVPVWAYPMRFL